MRDAMARAARYSWPQCRYCGRAQNHDCPVAVCLLCGSPQCFGNGGGSGRCSVCLNGLLPGWSGVSEIVHNGCGYARCDLPAVAVARKKPVCIDHANQIKVGKVTLAEHVRESIAHRDSGKGWQEWRLVS